MAMPLDHIPVFFIVGRERSGTTLLQMLLDNHPSVVMPTESPFIKHLYRKYAKRDTWSEKIILEFYKDLLDEPYLSLWDIDREKLKASLLALGEKASFASLCKTVYLHSLSAKGKHNVQLIGDKNPQYSLFIPQLIGVFPNAKFIFITRDHRDQVMSMMKVNFEKKIVASLAYRWKHFNREIDKCRKKYPGQFYSLKYEDLVQRPQEQLKAITQFLGIGYTDAMLDSSSRASFYVSSNALVRDHHKSLLKPIDPGMIERWKEEMSEDDVRMTDHVVGDAAEQFGYDRKFNNNSLALELRSLPGRIYGRLYFTFLDIMNALPYSWRMFLFRKFIAKKFRFWKESGRTR